MAWIEVHDNIWEHHKTLRLCEILSKPDFEVVGHLVSLWHFALRNAAESGDLKPWGDAAIERAARWDGAPGSFVKALRDVTFIDESRVHGWDDFTVHYKLILERRERKMSQVRKRVKRFREKRNASGNAHVTRCNAATLPNPTLPNPTLPNRTEPTTPPSRSAGSRSDTFDRFWQSYPRKVGKGAALKVWDRMRPPTDLIEKIIAAVEAQKCSQQWVRDGGQFIPHPSTWLNQMRWEDELEVNLPPAKSDLEADLERRRALDEQSNRIIAGE